MKHSIMVHVTGDVIQPVQVQQTQNGKTVARARIGVVEEREYQGQKQTHHAQWSVEAWGDLSRILASVPVGHTIMCEGKLVNESYTGQDGQKKWTTKIQAFRVANAGQSAYPPPQQRQPNQQQGYQQSPPMQGQQQRPPQQQTGWSPPQGNGYGAAPTQTPGYSQAPNPNVAPPQFDTSEEIPF